jgi:hypothetical protein
VLQTFQICHAYAFLPGSVGILLKSDGMYNQGLGLALPKGELLLLLVVLGKEKMRCWRCQFAVSGD